MVSHIGYPKTIFKKQRKNRIINKTISAITIHFLSSIDFLEQIRPAYYMLISPNNFGIWILCIFPIFLKMGRF